MRRLRLRVMPGHLAVVRLDAGERAPDWAWTGNLSSVTRTPAETSVVCAEEAVPAGLPAEGGWRALEVGGPLEFSAVGILASLTGPLAAAGLSIFALSTFDTDYVLVREPDLRPAITALKSAGHDVVEGR